MVALQSTQQQHCQYLHIISVGGTKLLGRASAVTVLLFIFLLAVCFIYFGVISKWEKELENDEERRTNVLLDIGSHVVLVISAIIAIFPLI